MHYGSNPQCTQAVHYGSNPQCTQATQQVLDSLVSRVRVTRCFALSSADPLTSKGVTFPRGMTVYFLK